MVATERTDRARREARAPERAPGGVLWIYGQAWEDRSALDGLRPPTPFDEWAATLAKNGWGVGWTGMGAIEEGPYRGGAVVEVDVDGDRAYTAIPPEALDRLRGLLDEQDYRMVREDVAALDNPEAHGLRVTRLDPAPWEQRRAVVPTTELMTEGWARSIRTKGLRVEAPAGALLPLDSAWPAGQVVTVADDAGRRFYFAVPRAALGLATDLHMETRERAPASSTAAAAAATPAS